MIRQAWRRLQLGRRGVAAIEYAIVLPVFLTVVFGTIEMGRLMWYQVALQRATAVAARCGGIANATCATDALTRIKAASSAPGLTLATSVFVVSRETCGVKVTGNLPFQYSLRYLGLPAQTLTSTACHPLVN